MRSPRTPMKSSPGSSQLEKAHAQQQRPNAAKNKLTNEKNKIKNMYLKCIYSSTRKFARNTSQTGAHMCRKTQVPGHLSPQRIGNLGNIYQEGWVG